MVVAVVVVAVVVVGEDTVRILPFPPISNSSVIVFKAAIAVEHEQRTRNKRLKSAVGQLGERSVGWRVWNGFVDGCFKVGSLKGD